MSGAVEELLRFFRAALVDPVGEARWDSPHVARRRRIVAVITLVVGSVILGTTIRLPTGSPLFVPLGLALAAVWAVGAFVSGPMHLGRAQTRTGQHLARPVVQPLVLGLAMLIVFLLGGLVVAHIPVLREPVEDLLAHSQTGPWAMVLVMTAVNGIAEELFFRGALYAAVAQIHPVFLTTVAYTLTTVGSGIPLLTFAAVWMGVVTGLQRRVTRGVLGPIVTHVTWSVGMLILLPMVF